MIAKIHLLDVHTVNQIAAGEVIENAASVVKELVENALDAGASEILVDLMQSGRTCLRVVDNGSGLSPADARLCFERHATSKIRSSSDIETVETMGFRGEALASIAAVSKVTLLTCHEEEATLVRVEGGCLIDAKPAARSLGTTLEVCDLFYNVPARRKFQKSPSYDEAQIYKVLSTMALGYPHVSFQLWNNKKMLFNFPKTHSCDFMGALKERMKDVLGAEAEGRMIPLQWSEDSVSLQGFLGTPSWTKTNKMGQHLFIKKRLVQCPLISFAILEGYGSMMAPRRFPHFLLHLDLPSDQLDVNVHPQKKEVRLRREKQLRHLMVQAVQKSFGVPVKEKLPWDSEWKELPWDMPCEKEAFTTPNASFVAEKEASSYLPLASSITPHVLGIWAPYILLDGASLALDPMPGLVLVDQRRAHQRILFEEWKDGRAPASQSLLFPLTFSFESSEASALRECLPDLLLLGFDIRESGTKSFIIEAIPAEMASDDIREALEKMIGNNGPASSRREQLTLSLVASATKRTRPLDLQEARGLMRRLFACSMPRLCPFGKSTMIMVSVEEFQKRFQ